mgnify:CR=1 FL=1
MTSCAVESIVSLNMQKPITRTSAARNLRSRRFGLVCSRGGLLVSVLLSLGLCLAPATANAAEPSSVVASSAFEQFRSFVTGETAVKYALVEMTAGRSATPQLFAFAYDTNAFFGREYCKREHDLNDGCLADKVCVRTLDRCLYYDGTSSIPVVYTSSSVDDTSAGAYGGFSNYFRIYAGLFQSYSISDQGTNALRYVDGRFSTVAPTPNSQNSQCVATIILDAHGLAKEADVFRTAQGHGVKERVLYAYNSAESRKSGIPSSSMIQGGGFSVTVLALELLPHGERLPDPLFIPNSLFTSTNISRVIHSNKMDYCLLPDGRLSSMDGRSPDREMADVRAGRFYFYMGTLTLFVLGAVLWRVRLAGHTQ